MLSALSPRKSIRRVWGPGVQEIVRSSLMVLAMLCAMPIEPNVAIKAGTLSLVTIRPLNRPNIAPMKRPMSSAKPACMPSRMQ